MYQTTLSRTNLSLSSQNSSSEIGKTVVMSAAVAVIAMLLFFAASYFSLGRDLAGARSQIRSAFEAGDLLEGANKALGNTIVGVHQYNDCLILGMSIDQRPGLERQLLVSPIRTAFPSTAGRHDKTLPPMLIERSDNADPCPVLHDLSQGDTPTAEVEYYHRYLHGQTILIRYLLPKISVSTIRLMYSSLVTVAVMIGFTYSLAMLATGVRT